MYWLDFDDACFERLHFDKDNDEIYADLEKLSVSHQKQVLKIKKLRKAISISSFVWSQSWWAFLELSSAPDIRQLILIFLVLATAHPH